MLFNLKTKKTRIITLLSFIFVLSIIFYNNFKSNQVGGLKKRVYGYKPISKQIFTIKKPEKIIPSDNIASWTIKNPSYNFTVYEDNKVDDIVKQHMSKEIYEAFNSLPLKILKADYFRYIQLYLNGGVYTDSDTICKQSINLWNDGHIGIEMIISIESYQPNPEYKCNSVGAFARDVQFTQWTIASSKGHPILLSVINKIKDLTSEMLKKDQWTYCDIMNWTGPGIWTDAVLEYLNVNDKREFDIITPKLFKGVYILPLTGFNFSYDDSNINYFGKVLHQFSGSWKNEDSLIFVRED